MNERPHATSAYSVQLAMLARLSRQGNPLVFKRKGGDVLHLRFLRFSAASKPYVAENLSTNQIGRFSTLPELRAYLKEEC